ncbi:MAG TPA: aminoacyl-tRNA hydrolase [Pyrinomonadaceae bacterium]|jgi:PTH1 family peptidyl-tRNA hydrolase|nr:aminoacyl-tRNA hydrolase [Pyrinomonadaceae bacterium]
MRLIVGLGNPGSEYERTRHNLGFMLIDKLASDAQVTVGRRECSALVGRAEIESISVKLVKPQTYMNLTGQTVSCLRAKHPAQAAGRQLIVITDDLALPLGKIRIRERGSAGGHNGLKSIIAAIGTNEFVRLRIGIQPDHPVSDSKKFVLDAFSRTERAIVKDVLDMSADAIRAILRDGVLKAMAKFN